MKYLMNMPNAMNKTLRKFLIERYNNKINLFILFISLLWVSVDINQRFFLKPSNYQSNNAVENIRSLHIPLLSKATTKKLEQTIAPYDQIEKTKTQQNNTNQKMSAEQQALQTGELKTVYIGENKIELKAIISNKLSITNKSKNKGVSKKTSQSALLQVYNSSNQQSSIEEYANYADVYGFQLTILGNTQVQLIKNVVKGDSADNNTTSKKTKNSKQQKIILTMYKPRT